MKFTLGADPEVFMKDATDSFMSAIEIIPGTKHDPSPIYVLGEGFAQQHDNVAVEYNIPPADSKQQFVNHIQKIMSYLADNIAIHGLKFSDVSATNEFPMHQLMHPEALEFGCDPDFNAWENGRVNPRPHATDSALRTAGGHVHFGMQFPKRKDLINFIKYIDLFYAVPAVLMDPPGAKRRMLYGGVGSFRQKPYGVEYRSLSNFWIFERKHIEWVWDAGALAVNAWQDGSINIDTERDAIFDAVNNNNQEAAKALIYRHNLLVV